MDGMSNVCLTPMTSISTREAFDHFNKTTHQPTLIIVDSEKRWYSCRDFTVSPLVLIERIALMLASPH